MTGRKRRSLQDEWSSGPILLLAFSKGMSQQGSSVPASTIFDNLLRQKVWYLHRRSQYLIAGKTTVLFYQSGEGVRGFAKVVSVDDITNADRDALQRYGLSHLSIRLELDDVEVFRKSVQIAPLVNRLDFVANKKYWGHSVRTTPRTINDRDFATLRAESGGTQRLDVTEG